MALTKVFPCAKSLDLSNRLMTEDNITNILRIVFDLDDETNTVALWHDKTKQLIIHGYIFKDDAYTFDSIKNKTFYIYITNDGELVYDNTDGVKTALFEEHKSGGIFNDTTEYKTSKVQQIKFVQDSLPDINLNLQNQGIR